MPHPNSENPTVSKSVIASLAIVAAAASLAACGKDQPSEPAATALAPKATEMAAEPHPVPAKADSTVDVAEISKAEGGQTVAEVFAGGDALAGQTVKVRGKVVKVNADIMGKNWIHVRDGSGSEGTNDLTVTTSTDVLPAVGDLVVVDGTVALNKDFGMGYKYPVIVEDAQVTVESSGD